MTIIVLGMYYLIEVIVEFCDAIRKIRYSSSIFVFHLHVVLLEQLSRIRRPCVQLTFLVSIWWIEIWSYISRIGRIHV